MHVLRRPIEIIRISRLFHARLLLTQHFLAVAADFMLRCSPSRGSGHSIIPTSVDFRPTLRRILHELTEGGRNGLLQVQLMLTQQMLATASPSFGGVASFGKPVVQMRSSRHSAKRLDLAENTLVS
jgi:hypothetical protein